MEDITNPNTTDLSRVREEEYRELQLEEAPNFFAGSQEGQFNPSGEEGGVGEPQQPQQPQNDVQTTEQTTQESTQPEPQEARTMACSKAPKVTSCPSS